MEYSKFRRGLRGFPVEYVVLGFLVEKPLHGYALRSCIAEGLGPLWHVASSQLYQVLHRLEERNCVRRSFEAPSAGPSKTVYHVTSNGEHAFWEWAQTPVDSMRNVRVEFAAKLYFLRRLKLEAVSTLIDNQLNVLEKIKGLVLSERRKGSDDSTLNSIWVKLQTTTIDNFARWLTDHHERLSTDEEKEG
ncbi:PadR family transcriptional regulator [Candidatus Bipolaricaulota bacterium]|nr:PadR family transcriptional regulator [Candidatus Bipolaricaulota bacterium]